MSLFPQGDRHFAPLVGSEPAASLLPALLGSGHKLAKKVPFVPIRSILSAPRDARLGARFQHFASSVCLVFALALFTTISTNSNYALAQQAKLPATSEDSAVEMIQRMETARASLQKQHLSVRAKGRVSGWIQTPSSPDPQHNLDAELVIMTDGPKFHLQLLHAPQPHATPPQPERLEMAVFDGKNIYSFYSSGDTTRGGVFFEFSQSAVLRSTGFPFSTLINFWDDAITLKELDSRAITMTDLGTHGYIMKEDRATYVRQVFMARESDLDIERVALRHPGAAVAFREHWLKWQKTSDDVRYVEHYVVRHRYAIKDAPEGQIIARQYEVDFDQFSHDVKHDAKSFTLEGIGVPVGTVFTDYRRNIKGKRALMKWNGSTLDELPESDSP